MRDSRKPATGKEIERAIEAFARGFCFTRSITHPYIWEKHGKAWVVRDAPRKNGKGFRREEWISHALAPTELDRLAQKNARGHYCICAIRAMDEDRQSLIDGYKSIGYRFGGPEAFMVHRMGSVPRFTTTVRIERVLTRELSDALAKAQRRKPMDERWLKPDSPWRQYAALDGSDVVGWVRSIAAGRATTWCSDVFVRQSHRRRGIGRAMMSRMLLDDRAHGAKRAALLACHSGAMLYPLVGYEQIAELLLFTPKRKK